MWLRLLSIRVYLAVDRLWRRMHRLLFFWRKGGGAEAFLERYRPDHVLAVTETERRLAPDFEKCLMCSLCTFSCQAIQTGEAPVSFEPKLLVGVFGKFTRDSEIFTEEWFPCMKCSACTVLCPNDVPVHAIVEQVIGRRGRLGFRRGKERDRH